MKKILEEINENQIEKFKACQTIEEVMAVSAEMNLEMNREKAILLLETMQEINDDKLREVSGGQGHGFFGTVSFVKNKNGL